MTQPHDPRLAYEADDDGPVMLDATMLDSDELPEMVPEIAAALEAGHRPILGTAIFDLPRRFLLNRYENPDNTTGIGAVAWGVLWPSGEVSVHWQTDPAVKGGFYPSMEAVVKLHGHQTAVEWVDV